MRRVIIALALFSGMASASCPAPINVGDCVIDNEDVGLPLESAMILKITGKNAYRYSYRYWFAEYHKYGDSQTTNDIKHIEENYQPIKCPGE